MTQRERNRGKKEKTHRLNTVTKFNLRFTNSSLRSSNNAHPVVVSLSDSRCFWLDSRTACENDSTFGVVTPCSTCRRPRQAEQSPPRRWRERERSKSRVCVNGNDEFSLQTRAVPFNARRSLARGPSLLKEFINITKVWISVLRYCASH